MPVSPSQVAASIQRFTSNYNTLLKQGRDMKSKGMSVGANVNKLLKLEPLLKYRMDVVTAFMFAVGYSSTELALAYVKSYSLAPLKMLKLLQASGMLPNQIQSFLNTLGGDYASLATKAIQNVAVQTVINWANMALAPAEQQLRSSAQVAVTWITDTGDAIVKVLEEIGEALNPSNWF